MLAPTYAHHAGWAHHSGGGGGGSGFHASGAAMVDLTRGGFMDLIRGRLPPGSGFHPGPFHPGSGFHPGSFQ